MMDIQARKIQFVQEFLRIADDELVALAQLQEIFDCRQNPYKIENLKE